VVPNKEIVKSLLLDGYSLLGVTVYSDVNS